MLPYYVSMDGTKKILILSDNMNDGQELVKKFKAGTDLEVVVSANPEELIANLYKIKNNVFAVILILDEVELGTIVGFGRHLYLSANNPDLKFLAAVKGTRRLDFEVFFFNFPLITIDYADVNTLPLKLMDLKQAG